MKAQLLPRKTISLSQAQEMLTERFGSISDPIPWFGVNSHGIRQALEALPHALNRDGVLSDFTNTSKESIGRKIAVAYTVARLVSGRDIEVVPPEFNADHKRFGVVALIGVPEAAVPLLEVPLDEAYVGQDGDIGKWHFVSPTGFCATLRQPNSAQRSSFVVNGEGKAELAIQELLPDAQMIVAAQVA